MGGTGGQWNRAWKGMLEGAGGPSTALLGPLQSSVVPGKVWHGSEGPGDQGAQVVFLPERRGPHLELLGLGPVLKSLLALPGCLQLQHTQVQCSACECQEAGAQQRNRPPSHAAHAQHKPSSLPCKSAIGSAARGTRTWEMYFPGTLVHLSMAKRTKPGISCGVWPMGSSSAKWLGGSTRQGGRPCP